MRKVARLIPHAHLRERTSFELGGEGKVQVYFALAAMPKTKHYVTPTCSSICLYLLLFGFGVEVGVLVVLYRSHHFLRTRRKEGRVLYLYLMRSFGSHYLPPILLFLDISGLCF